MVVSDGVFSADGDVAPLNTIVELKERYNARLFLDDAHGVGVLGALGRGLTEECELLGRVDFIVGTMTKAFGSTGGFALFGDAYYHRVARHMCPTYTSSRAVSPSAAAASLCALEINRAEGPDRRKALSDTSRTMANKLVDIGCNMLNSRTPIVPVICGEVARCFSAWEGLTNLGYLSAAFVPPYVPPGTARLRLGVTYNHTLTDVNGFADAVETIGLGAR